MAFDVAKALVLVLGAIVEQQGPIRLSDLAAVTGSSGYTLPISHQILYTLGSTTGGIHDRPGRQGSCRDRLSGGNGAATAKRFATLGASVVIADLNGLGAQMVVDEITAEGGYAVACQADVRDEEPVHTMVMIAVEAFGGLDVLHNNAANMSSEIIGNDRDVETMTVERWDETFAVAFRGAMLGCKHAVPLMRRARWPIINTASTSGQTGELIRAAYGAAKAGVINLTRSVATSYGHEGIRCNAIAPG